MDGFDIPSLLIRSWERNMTSRNISRNTINTYLAAARDLNTFLSGELRPTWVQRLAASKKITEAEVLRVYREHHRQLAEVTDIQLDAVTATGPAIEIFIAWVLVSTSPGNAHNRYRALQQWGKWVAKQEKCPNPMADLQPPIVPPQPVPITPNDLMKRVLAGCEGRTLLPLRDTAIIKLLWGTGIRLSECAKLELPHVDLKHDRINVLGKGRIWRTVKFSDDVADALTRYLRVRAQDPYAEHPMLWLAEKGKGPLTPNGIKLMLRRRGRAAGVNEEMGRNLHAHLGRHAYSHEWQLAEGNEGDLMYNNGWTSRQNLDRYAASARSVRAEKTAAKLALGDRLK